MSDFRSEISFLDATDNVRGPIDRDGVYKTDDGEIYTLGIAEEQDLPDVARLVVATFGAEVIRVSQDFGQFERLLMQPAVDVVNGYSGLVAFAEVLSGMRQRLRDRLEESKISILPPPLKGQPRDKQLRSAASKSLILIIGRTRLDNDWQVEVIGSVELQMQICDGKIPFTLPFLDIIERTLGRWVGVEGKGANFQPYLSNLCVSETYRGKGIGKALVRCVEDIAGSRWQASKLYLHVDPENKPARTLYEKEGYTDVGLRWRPFWAGRAAEIGYYSKSLK
jgi:ribosomal protein S18 acetylase RimI-like enzyme